MDACSPWAAARPEGCCSACALGDQGRACLWQNFLLESIPGTVVEPCNLEAHARGCMLRGAGVHVDQSPVCTAWSMLIWLKPLYEIVMLCKRMAQQYLLSVEILKSLEQLGHLGGKNIHSHPPWLSGLHRSLGLTRLCAHQ